MCRACVYMDHPIMLQLANVVRSSVKVKIPSPVCCLFSICASTFWLVVPDVWCWFVVREKYCWLSGGWRWFGVREKLYWLVGWQASWQPSKLTYFVGRLTWVLVNMMMITFLQTPKRGHALVSDRSNAFWQTTWFMKYDSASREEWVDQKRSLIFLFSWISLGMILPAIPWPTRQT